MTRSLLDPVRLGTQRLRNRIVLPPHTTNFAADDSGRPTDRYTNYLLSRASNGPGLIITETIRMFPPTYSPRKMGIFADTAIDSFRTFTDALHSTDTVVFAQVNEPGRHQRQDRLAPVGPSASPWKVGGLAPHVLTINEIHSLVKSIGQGVSRLERSGFDGIELQLGHGHLFHQFLSPASNRREDQYGGSLNGRLRLVVELLDEIRACTDLPVGLRISGDDFVEDGLGPEDMGEVIAGLAERFALLYLHVSQSAYVGEYSLATQVPDMSFGPAPFRSIWREVKRQFPETVVIGVGRIDSLEIAADIIAKGDADLVGLARAHIADPDFVAKSATHQKVPIRRCIACNEGCLGRLEQGLAISCVVNPQAGLEGEFASLAEMSRAPAEILVVGGGPAGCEAAVVAARHGHSVTLVDESEWLGGQLRVAAQLRGRSMLGKLIEDFSSELDRLNVAVYLNNRVESADIVAGGWDTVILACGSEFKKSMDFGLSVVTPLEAVAATSTLGHNVVLIDEEGGWISAGLMDHLNRVVTHVSIVTPLETFVPNINTYSRLAILRRLRDSQATLRTHSRPVRTDRPNALRIINELMLKEETLFDIESLVHVGGRTSSDTLLRDLVSSSFEGDIYVIGDSYAPRTALEAVYEGHLAGIAIGVSDRDHVMRRFRGYRPPTSGVQIA